MLLSDEVPLELIDARLQSESATHFVVGTIAFEIDLLGQIR
jgi:hypothetical protein